MNLLVLGATGGTGRELVRQALDAGHDVTAFVRDPRRLTQRHPRMRTVSGDVLDRSAVARVLPGHDAVRCLLGSSVTKVGTVRSEGTRNIVCAMEKGGVRRLVCLGSLGYGDSREALKRTSVFFKYALVPLLMGRVFADHQRQEERVKGSALDWIIVRPGSLTNGPRTGAYRHGFPANDATIKVIVSRADVADFMLKQLNDDTNLRQTPRISY
jgi:putative NADH-flavin reductase